jgi:hypothetical protein
VHYLHVYPSVVEHCYVQDLNVSTRADIHEGDSVWCDLLLGDRPEHARQVGRPPNGYDNPEHLGCQCSGVFVFGVRGQRCTFLRCAVSGWRVRTCGVRLTERNRKDAPTWAAKAWPHQYCPTNLGIGCFTHGAPPSLPPRSQRWAKKRPDTHTKPTHPDENAPIDLSSRSSLTCGSDKSCQRQ